MQWCACRVEQPWAGLLLVALGIALLIIGSCYTWLCHLLLQSSDLFKAVFVLTVHPLIFEFVLLTPCRLLLRLLRHNHPSATFLPITVFIIFKQVFGRFVVAMIDNNQLVFVVSMGSALTEFLFRTSLTARDASLYRAVFGRCLRNDQDPAAHFTSGRAYRSQFLRADSSMFETLGEIVAIWNGVILVLAYDISKDGHSSPSLRSAVVSACIQTLAEYATDFASLLALAVKEHRNLLQHAHQRLWIWSLPTTPGILFASALLCDVLLARTLCHYPDSRSLFVICKGE